MKLRLLRRISVGLIAVLAFAQASVAIAACTLDRGSLSQMMAPSSDMPCADCGTSVSDFGPLYANRCVAHCTSDLQLSASLAALAVHPADVPVLVLPRAGVYHVPRAVVHVSPSGAVPVRILLHSFQV
jgi:hypothetical protein